MSEHEDKPDVKLTEVVWAIATKCFSGARPLAEVIEARPPEIESMIVNLVQRFDEAVALPGGPEDPGFESALGRLSSAGRAFKDAVLAGARTDIEGLPEPGSEDDIVGTLWSAPPGTTVTPETACGPGHELESAVHLSELPQVLNEICAEDGLKEFCDMALFGARRIGKLAFFQHENPGPKQP